MGAPRRAAKGGSKSGAAKESKAPSSGAPRPGKRAVSGSGRAPRTPEARFTCQSCGRCCTMWSVTVDSDKVARLREHDWSAIGAGDPFEKNRGPGDAYRVRMVKGRCFFLDEEQRCRIHSELGYDEKPEGCKAFPLHFVEVGGQPHGRLSFYCPSVTADTGKRLVDQQRWLRATQRAAGDVARTSKITLDEELEVGLKDAERIVDQQLSWFRREDETVADRVAAGAGLLVRMIDLAADKGTHAIGSVLKDAARSDAFADFVAAGRADAQPSRAGPIFSLFLGADCAPGKLSRFGHFFGVRAFNLGLGRLRSHFVRGKASRKQIAAVRFDPPTVHNALLTRYFTHKLEGRRTLAGEASLMGGYNLLVAAYGVIDLLARLSAVTAGRQECDEHDVAAAVQAADLLVVEHTTLRHGAMFGQLVAAVLAAPGLCAALLARRS